MATFPAIGAPQLQGLFDIALPALAVADIAITFFGPLRWGLFNSDNTPALVADNVVGVEYRRDWRISTYPLEQGAFASYDKVQMPFDIRIRLSVGGTESAREAFLNDLEDVSNSLDLFNVFTPEFHYLSACVMHVDYRRESDRGAGLIVADIWLQEVRVSGTQGFTSTAAPSGADPVDGGVVQPAVPSSTEAGLAGQVT